MTNPIAIEDTTTILVTGGNGFIGSALIRKLLACTKARIIDVDSLTYASSPATNADLMAGGRYHPVRVDICDHASIDALVQQEKPEVIFHLAAESHVDRSIGNAAVFINTNVMGTYTMLETARRHYDSLSAAARDRFRFLHISTDEVFGSIDQGLFTEQSPQHPNSPYSASKSASDMFGFAWHATYGLPVIISNCSNNYGPRQFPEKLMPLMILNALHGRPLPVYGDGLQIRDWIFVDDHADALIALWQRGAPGQRYNIGANTERANIDIVKSICRILDERHPSGAPHARHIVHVTDRPGHDRRYAIDSRRIQADAGWTPAHGFETGLAETVDWYLANENWWRDLYDRLEPPSFLKA